MPERYAAYDGGRISVNLPRDAKYSDPDPSVDKDTSVVISLPNEDSIYLGKSRGPIMKEDLGYKLKQLLQNNAESDRMVYVAANAANDYKSVVRVLYEIRELGVSHVGLLALRRQSDEPSRFAIEIPAQRDPNEDLSQLKPNPLTLVVSLSPDLKIRLNQEDYGSVNDSEPLVRKLLQIFQLRQDQHVMRPGFESRSDLPSSQRIEKTLTIKAPVSIKYGDVMKIVDAVKGAGAAPIVLQLDDLPL